MKKRLTVLLVSLALCAGGVAAAVLLRPPAVGARQEPPDPPKADKEAPADAPPKTAASRITRVTVYPNSALVTREVDVPAGAGALELVVTPLPPGVVEGSLYSEGSEGVRVLTTRFRTRQIQEDVRDDVRKLEDESRKLQQEAQKLQADLKAVQDNMGLLGKLENFTSFSTQNGADKGKLDSDATIALAKYLMDGRTEKTKELVALQQQIQTNAGQLEFVARKLRESAAGASRVQVDAVIVVDKAKAAAGTVRLNYLVQSASWLPQYKLRAGATDKDPVQVEYLAAVTQQTGEDWQDVSLVLSTAEPTLNAAPPELQTLAVALIPKASLNPESARSQFQMNAIQPSGLQLGLQLGQIPFGADNPIPNPQGATTARELNEAAQALRQQALAEINRKNKDAGKAFWNYAGALEQARDLALDEPARPGVKGMPAQTAAGDGPSVSYHLDAKLTVPSRGDEQVVEVARLEMPPDYFYKAVPVLTAQVYKQATLTNKSKYVLLSGEATMYNGTDFVGRMNLPLVAIGEQFTVGFGAEPQLQVQRQIMDKSRTMQGGNQVLTFDYRILVSSYKAEKVRLQVWDRLPAAENETMLVSLVKTGPEVSKDAQYLREDRPHNLLRWDLDVNADANGDKAEAIQYQFKLEWAKDMTFGTFQTK